MDFGKAEAKARMIFTAKQQGFIRRLRQLRISIALLCCAFFIGISFGALAEGHTHLTVSLKGIAYVGQEWLSIPLSGRFEVQTLDGIRLGYVRANPSEEQMVVGEIDTITVPDRAVTAVRLIPIEEDFPKGFVTNSPATVPLNAGGSEFYTVVMYAEMGIFSVRNTIAQTGGPAVNAEFVVVNHEGKAMLSFITDENGEYTSSKPLPIGDYKLMQMNAATDTLLLQTAKPFTLQTYFGNPEEITRIEVQNEKAPLENGQASVNVLNAGIFAQRSAEADSFYYADFQITAGSMAPNKLPLHDFTVEILPTAFVDTADKQMEITTDVQLVSFTWQEGTTGLALSVQGLNSRGEAVAEAQTVSSGQEVALQNTAGLRITYVNQQTGDRAVPEQFDAGVLGVTVRYEPAPALETANSIREVAFQAKVDYTFQFPNATGTGKEARHSESEPADIRLAVPSGKSILEAKAVADAFEGRISLSIVQDDEKLPGELLAAATLPQGVRVDVAAALESAELLRTQATDSLIFTLQDLRDGNIVIPVKTGTVSAIKIQVADPCTLMKTADNPDGASIEAIEHSADPLLSIFEGRTNAVYSRIPVTLEGKIEKMDSGPFSLQMLNGVMYEDPDRSGTRSSGEAVMQNHGVLLRGEQTGIHYGAITDVRGRYTIWGPINVADKQATLITMIPENATTIGNLNEGRMERPGINIPEKDYPISFTSMGKISGNVVLDSYRPFPGARVELWRGQDIVGEMVTGESGAYAFTDLLPDAYHVALHLPEDTTAMLLARSDVNIYSRFELKSNAFTLEQGQAVDLSFAAVSMRAIHGTVTYGGEPLAKVQIEMLSSSGKKSKLVTDEAGTFAFNGLVDADHQLSILLPDMLSVVRVNGEEIVPGNPYQMQLTVPTGSTVRVAVETESLGVLKGNIPQVGAGQAITAASLNGQITTETDEIGGFSIRNLAAGEYTVYAPLVPGKSLEEGSQWHITQRGDMIWTSATIQTGQTTNLPEVRYVAMTSIEGVAYVDDSGDLIYNEGEQLMGGITVVLQRKNGTHWEDVDTVQTNEYGTYAFRNLRADVYRVASMIDADGMQVAAVGPVPISLGRSGVMVTGDIALEESTTIQGQSDVALTVPALLRFAAFDDSNENGVRGEYERPIAGVLFEVIDEDGVTVIASAVTDASGEGGIDYVPFGERSLRVTMPAGYMITQKGQGEGLDVSCVGGSGGGSAVSEKLSFESGRTVTVGAAAVPMGSFSGKVWNDLNNNGLMDEDEPGVPGIELVLKGTKTKDPYILTTDDTGEYCFPFLRSDQYSLSTTLPEGHLFARYSTAGGDLRSVFTTAGRTAARQFPLKGAADVVNKNVGVIQEGILEGIAFLDFNFNGVKDEGEAGYAGVRVELIRVRDNESMGAKVTAEDGVYRFTGLRGGDYSVRAILPDDGSVFTVLPAAGTENANQFAARTGRRENTITPVAVKTAGVPTSTLVGVAQTAKIQGSVFLDDNYDGEMGGKEKKLSGIKIELRDRSGATLQAVATSNKGTYLFEGILPGEYQLHFLRKANHAFTRWRPTQENGNWVRGLTGDQGFTEAFTVTMGEDMKDVNAGMLPCATLTGVLFHDLNDNGLRDAGEDGMTAASVNLYSEEAEIDLSSEVGADGRYFFDGVMPGSYTITYHLPEHTELAKTAENGNTLAEPGQSPSTAPFSVALGTANEYPLVGAVTLGSFEGTFFHDPNASGQIANELMSGLELTFTPDRADLEPVQAVAEKDGSFSVTGLRPANYRLTARLPEGFIFSYPLTQDGLPFNTVQEQVLPCSWQTLTSRTHYNIGAVKPAVISGYVFLDENRDSKQGADEALMGGLSFQLIDEATGRMVAETKTSDDGTLMFAGVRPGSYTAQFFLPEQSESANDAQASMQLENGRMLQKGIAVTEAGHYDGVRAGIVSRTSIGGTMSLDEGGVRTQLEGIQIKLFQGKQAEPVQTVRTNAAGRYRFDGLWPDEYRLEAELPEGMIFVRPDDPNYQNEPSAIKTQGSQTGSSDTFALAMAKHQLRENIFLIRPAKVGDQAWIDLNKNGLLDGGEPLLPGVTVSLVSNGQVVEQTQTNEFGYYLFPAVYPGTYTLRAAAYPELTITQHVLDMPLLNSCLIQGDGNGAESGPVTAESGKTHMDYDFGYILKDGQGLPAGLPKPMQKDWTGAYISPNW